MNQAMLRNLTPNELERHLWITEPYSPAHLAVLAMLEEIEETPADIDQDDINYEATEIKSTVATMEKGVNNAMRRLEILNDEIFGSFESCLLAARSISASADNIQRNLDL
tara:strand:- start:47785 stop:48114 length:330 start_codon:yes stop_codon:yes gene_type:complete